MPQTVLISGSSGYIGSHFVKYFTQSGWNVVGLDKVRPTSAISKYLSANLHADMSEEERVYEFCKTHGAIGVVHCAAKCLVGESVQDPEGYHDNNVIRGGTFLEAVVRAGVEAFLFSSSAAVYGEPEKTPIPEDHPKNPINPYGATKWAFEQSLSKREGLAVGSFRYFNAAGADPETELGEVHDPETHLIPNAIRTALGVDTTFNVLGTDYPTRDGTCERDYIHVWDLAAAHELLLRKLLKSEGSHAYNLGTGNGYTVKEVLDELDQQVGKKISRTHSPRRVGDPATLVADPTKAKKELDWNPTHSDLSTIIQTALRWHRLYQEEGR